MDWLWNQDASHDLLLAVHPPNYIVLWNGDTGTKLWKKSYAENILSFSFDPFDPSNLACTRPNVLTCFHAPNNTVLLLLLEVYKQNMRKTNMTCSPALSCTE